MMTQKDDQQLERMIDAYTLKEVLERLSEIASGKADHIRENRQDDKSARPWRDASNRIEETARQVSV